MDKEKILRIVGAIVAVVFLVCVGWYLLCERDVHDQRERANDVRESLERAGNEQRNVESNLDRLERGLDDSIGRVDEVSSRINDAKSAITASQERRGECESLIEDSERRTSESRAILQGIRERARQNGK